MTTAIEEQLRQRLAELADGAPATMHLTGITTRVVKRRRRRTAVRGTLVGLAFTGVATSLYALQVSRPADRSSTVSVAGPSESPLVRMDKAYLSSSIVKPGAIALQLADGQRLAFGVVGQPYFDGYAQSVVVQIGAATNGRFVPATADVNAGAQTELGGNDTVVFWTGLPASVARVEFHPADGGTTWQTPIAGIAAFPVASHSPNDTLIGYNAAGTEIQRISWSAAKLSGSTTIGDDPTITSDYSSITEPATVPDVNIAMLTGLTQLQEDEYRAFGNDTMRSCLAVQGDSAWTACIESTDSAVKQYLKDLQASLAPDNATAPTTSP
jgi:hypothetical protein